MAKLVNKPKNYSEAELIQLFSLIRLPYGETPLMKEWTDATTTLTVVEQVTFDRILQKARRSLEGWQEEELKMKFLAFVLELGGIDDHDEYLITERLMKSPFQLVEAYVFQGVEP